MGGAERVEGACSWTRGHVGTLTHTHTHGSGKNRASLALRKYTSDAHELPSWMFCFVFVSHSDLSISKKRKEERKKEKLARYVMRMEKKHKKLDERCLFSA